MSKYEEIWELLDKYTFKIEPELSEYVSCVICDNLLLDACQAPCGCVYCKVCIEKTLENGHHSCPGEGCSGKDRKISMADIIQNDNSANKRVSKLMVKCPNEFCNYQSELRNMCIHVPMCEKKQAQNDELRKELAEVKNKFNEFSRSIDEIRNNTDKKIAQLQQSLEDGLKKMRLELNKHKDNDERRDKKIFKMQEEIKELQERNVIEQVAVPIEKDLAVKFVWDIDRISRVRKKGVVVWSELFYSSNQEYLMRLWFHPNGSAVGTAAHLSIEFCICDDANNPLLKWPIKCEITIFMKNKVKPDIHPKSISKNCLMEKSVFPQFSSEYFHFNYSDKDVIELLEDKSISIECQVDIRHR